MNSVEKILNKKYKKPLLANKSEKEKWLKIKECLHTYHIPCEGKTDWDVLQYEIIYESIVVKQKLEEVFFDVYVHMYTYWCDLTYIERKRQMNMDIDRTLSSLKHFYVDGERICMPCFEPDFNHLYTTEIVLLDLKQYHIYIRNFAPKVKQDVYGVLPYVHGFCSAKVMAQTDTKFVLYHSGSFRLYYYKEHRLHSYVSFDPTCTKQEEDEESLKQIAHCMLLEDELQMMEHILASHLIKDRMKKKLRSLQKKLETKRKKK